MGEIHCPRVWLPSRASLLRMAGGIQDCGSADHFHREKGRELENVCSHSV